VIPTINFGLSGYIPDVLYISYIIVVLLSIFWKPVAGIYYLAPLLPAQTTRDRLADYPLGGSVVTVVLLAVAIGLLRRGEPLFPKSRLRGVTLFYIALTFVSLLLGTLFLTHDIFPDWADSRFIDWRNYATMFMLVFLTAAAVKTTKEMKILLVIICFGVLMFNRSFYNEISGQDFSSFHEDERNESGSGYAGVNGFAAFEAQTAAFLIGLSGFLEKRKHRWTALALAGTSLYCTMFSFSRAGYISVGVALLFLGIVKYRKLLALMAVFAATWTTIVPGAVYERVTMTTNNPGGELDHSSETRVNLWEEAFDEVKQNPVLGLGFNTYAYIPHLSGYRDSHNIYVKFLVETGYVGIAIFLALLFKYFNCGLQLFRKAQNPFHAGLGLGLAGWVVAAMVGNMFGDRFTYTQVAGYMFVFAGMVLRAWQMELEPPAELEDEAESDELVAQLA